MTLQKWIEGKIAQSCGREEQSWLACHYGKLNMDEAEAAASHEQSMRAALRELLEEANRVAPLTFGSENGEATMDVNGFEMEAVKDVLAALNKAEGQKAVFYYTTTEGYVYPKAK